MPYKIGYDVPADKIHALTERAFEKLQIETPKSIEFQHGFQLRTLETANDAVTWGGAYHTKDIRNLIKTRHQVNKFMLDESIKSDISLATPKLLTVTSNTAIQTI